MFMPQTSFGIATHMYHDQYGAHFDATPTLPATTYGVFRYAVTPGYVETMRIPLRAGRLINEHDGAGAPLVAIVSESVATQRFGGTAAIGQRLRIDWYDVRDGVAIPILRIAE